MRIWPLTNRGVGACCILVVAHILSYCRVNHTIISDRAFDNAEEPRRQYTRQATSPISQFTCFSQRGRLQARRNKVHISLLLQVSVMLLLHLAPCATSLCRRMPHVTS